MEFMFTVPYKKRIRVIVDTDAACEADDQYAIVHALLTQRFDIRGIVAEQFYPDGGEESMQRSYHEIEKILGLMGMKDNVLVCHGAVEPLSSETEGVDSESARLIIQEALREDERPLFILCLGALTNMASALLLDPRIADRLTCIWIGGGMYPKGNKEFNLGNDIHAANVVFASTMALWQVPMNCYTTMRVSYAELQRRVRPCGKIGRYLFDEMQELAHSPNGWWTMGESWSLGDSPAVGLALHPPMTGFDIIQAPRATQDCLYIRDTGYRSIRVYHQVDVRFILEDFFSKLEIFCAVSE